ncbi:hypothetical protein [Paenibacillus sp. P46E]|uniref:hypothetical protein n=1 Tax=Paenibacillus sp. P46E TaxID=1349436 RepID=UPI00093A1432|nr:hypothetical protein [Paenibacillus sp. P46E]OKP99954.1 hypothetical protein A3849_01820 [Paenibacillus sp. P46E]
MPDPVSLQPASEARFAEYVQKYSRNVCALSSLLLGQGTGAEEATIKTFAVLYEPFLKKSFDPQAFSLEAYRACIQQCSRLAQAQNPGYANVLSWEHQLVQALRYGMVLPLPEISAILQRSVPDLKAQLRQVREQMATQAVLLPKSSLTAG